MENSARVCWTMMPALMIVLLTGLVFYWILCHLSTRRSKFLFFPLKGKPQEPSVEFRHVDIATEDGEKLHGWFIPNQASDKLVVYFHGNGGNLGTFVEPLAEIHKIGYNVLAADYRGYGLSTGEPSEAGILLDAQAVLQYARELKFADVILYGYSMGSVPSTFLADKFGSQITGIVVHNAFTDIWDVARANHLIPCIDLVASILKTKLTPKIYLSRVQCPVLVVHSEKDNVCPLQLGKELLGVVPHKSKRLVQLKGDHTNFEYSHEYYHCMKTFFLC